MPQFMIELAHSADECVRSLKTFDSRAPDLLYGTSWDCVSGRHAGWVVVNADSEDEAPDMVPENLRGKATATEVDVIPELPEALDPEAANPGIQEPFAS